MNKTVSDMPDLSRSRRSQKANRIFFIRSHFYRKKNEAINTVYAFCRETDDIVDEENADIEKIFKDQGVER